MDQEDGTRTGDEWLTVGEIAEELRLRPVTVRAWIAKGRLRAKRAGQRKWLVRRADLNEMLNQEETLASFPPPPPPGGEWAGPDDRPPDDAYRVWADEAAERESEQLAQSLHAARYDWYVALEQSAMAPPDARFATRIRQIAQAARLWAAVLGEQAGVPGYVHRPTAGTRGMTLSYELRPGGNRPGPRVGWGRVDRVVERLGEALEGDSVEVLRTALGDLSRALSDVADAINGPLAAPAGADESADQSA
jgi:excisionase family DNA binding protein